MEVQIDSGLPSNSVVNQELKCSICQKTFKTKKTFQKKTAKQLCCPSNLRTFCIICDINLETHPNYRKHLCSKSHLMKVDAIQLADYQLNEDERKKDNTATFQADPYLSNQEKKEFSPSNSTSTSNSTPNLEPEPSSLPPTPQPPSYEDSFDPQKSIPIPTEKQSKILTLLGKLYTEADAETRFLKLLNSLHVPDYRNLSLLIINYEGIPILEKQKFMDVIQKYKNLLIQKYNQGLTEFKGKTIKEIINFL